MKKTLSRLIAVLLVAGISVGAFAQVSQEQAAAGVRLQDLRATVALALTKAAEAIVAGAEFAEWSDYAESVLAELGNAVAEFEAGNYDYVPSMPVPPSAPSGPGGPDSGTPVFGDEQPIEDEATRV